jgi:hypothetical protein
MNPGSLEQVWPDFQKSWVLMAQINAEIGAEVFGEVR